MPNENRLPFDEIDVEGTFSAVMNEFPIFKLSLSSPLSNPGSLVTNSVAPVAIGVKLKPFGPASDDTPNFWPDGSLMTEVSVSGAALSPVLLLKWKN